MRNKILKNYKTVALAVLLHSIKKTCCTALSPSHCSVCVMEYVPESLGLVVYGSSKAARLLVIDLRDDLCVFKLIGIRSKFDGDGFGCGGRLLPVQLFNGIFCLRALVKAYKRYTAGKT